MVEETKNNCFFIPNRVNNAKKQEEKQTTTICTTHFAWPATIKKKKVPLHISDFHSFTQTLNQFFDQSFFEDLGVFLQVLIGITKCINEYFTSFHNLSNIFWIGIDGNWREKKLIKQVLYI